MASNISNHAFYTAEGGIKTRSAVPDVIKTAAFGIKTFGTKNEKEGNEAAEKVERAGKGALVYGVSAFNRVGNQSAKQTIKNVRKFSAKRKAIKTKRSVQRKRKKTLIKTNKPMRVTSKRLQTARKNAIKRKAVKQTAKATVKGTKTAVKTAKAAVKVSAKAVKTAVMAAKTLITALIAGGWVIVIVIIVCCLFGAALYCFGSSNDYSPVSKEVEAYTPIIEKYAAEYGIADYVDLIKAVMMQESKGLGSDPMQSSECGFNTRFPHTPNAITDPEYSIACGIQCLKAVLAEAGVKNPVDMDHIKLALQGYNFGNGYIGWAKARDGGYTKSNAIAFSDMMKKQTGSSVYGDTDYPDHVLRYYPFSGNTALYLKSGGILNLPIEGMTKAHITDYFGYRESPGGIGSTNHQGLDLGFPTGTPVFACESGTVTTANFNGGYGNCIIIDHGNGLQTLYGHLSEIGVTTNQKVIRGQSIGRVGSTGNSTGPHLHLEVRVNGRAVDPLGFLIIE